MKVWLLGWHGQSRLRARSLVLPPEGALSTKKDVFSAKTVLFWAESAFSTGVYCRGHNFNIQQAPTFDMGVLNRQRLQSADNEGSFGELMS